MLGAILGVGITVILSDKIKKGREIMTATTVKKPTIRTHDGRVLNTETVQALEETYAGIDLVRFDSAEEMFADWDSY
jgi:uncharacterized protein Veg